MKHWIRNFFATTGLSLLLLAVVATLYDASFLCISSVFQTGAANLAIHGGLPLLKRIESEYLIVEISIEIGYILAVIIACGYWFDWYGSTPVWVLTVMGLVVYAVGCAVDILHIKNDVNQINELIQLRKRNRAE